MSASHDAAPLYVVAPHTRPFKSHWSLFLPDTISSTSTGPDYKPTWLGRRIHVTGDVANGFTFEIVRSYDVKKHRGVDAARQFLIGSVPRQYLAQHDARPNGELVAASTTVVKNDDEGGGFVDADARDDFEMRCAGVAAPGKSLNSSSQPLHNGKRPKVELKDCQWWVRQVVRDLVDCGMLQTSPQAENSPIALVDSLPLH